MKDNQHTPPGNHDDVGTLVRLAGKRRPVPQDRAERVRQAARARWRHEVARRGRTRRVWSVAGLGAAAMLVLAVALRFLAVGNGASTGSEIAILVESMSGPAWSRATVDGETLPRRALATGASVRTGSELVTAEQSRVAIRLASGHSVRLDGSTRVRLFHDGSLALDRGAVYVDSGFAGSGTGSLDVHTSLGVIEEIGTQFEVRLNEGSVLVRLREGRVVFHHDQRDHEVQAGTELLLAPDGSVTRQALATHGNAWEWIVGITPMLDLEGRSARVFLDWIARERGLKLAFADVSVARSAEQTVLGGTVERLTLDEALDAVLPTCRLTYRVEDGLLLIDSTP